MHFYWRNNVDPHAILWYSHLTPHQRITLKVEFVTLCGVSYEEIIKSGLLTLPQVISIFYNKLIKEGIINFHHRDFNHD